MAGRSAPVPPRILAEPSGARVADEDPPRPDDRPTAPVRDAPPTNAPYTGPDRRRATRRERDRRELGFKARRGVDAEVNWMRRVALLDYLRGLPAETLWRPWPRPPSSGGWVLQPLWCARQDSEPFAASGVAASRDASPRWRSRTGREASGIAPGRTRTCDPRLRRPVLYPPELRAHAVANVSVTALWRSPSIAADVSPQAAGTSCSARRRCR